MTRLALAALALAVALPAAAQQARPAQSLEDAQAQLRAAIAQLRAERAAAQQPAKGSTAAAAPKRVAKLACREKKSNAASLQGTLDLDTLALLLTRAPAAKPVTQTDERKVVDDRCGRLLSPLADSLTYEVTPVHYWGQDLLQLPKSSPEANGRTFEAQLHTCQYDGEWHADSDTLLVCELTPQ
jgi:hypothetical protein